MKIAGNNIELQIIRLFNRGDSSAMDELYDRYADYLTGVCTRYITADDDLKDVLQESFIKIFMGIGSFSYRGKGSLKAWMSRIVVNESLLFLRKKRLRAPEKLLADPPDIPEEEPDTDHMDSTDLARFIRQLPAGYREIFNLFAIEGLSHKEIASKLGIKPDSSASQFHRAKNLLARMIKEQRTSADAL
ncbi:RNA polymerase subunit sigma [Prevotella sp. oral taxon 376]|uniref:RNA polymerase sigma factor n=1 Tax=Prevotella sp. oral taxon 376 TaxID=712466 RepID=UPI000D1F6D20|nr:sigma-70 family RNA polymerase sigma factor [Prevotella sp. oral taxon 376]PTL33734.1 RNA polymerase subunit sigma [Prevotella sp. oral taxon 376]